MKTEYIILISIITFIVAIDLIVKNHKKNKIDITSEVVNQTSGLKKTSLWILTLYSLLISLFTSTSIYITESYINYYKFIKFDDLQDFLSYCFDRLYYRDLDIFITYFTVSIIVCTLLFHYKKIINFRLFKSLNFIFRNIKSIVLFLLSIIITKPLLHYLLYPMYVERLTGRIPNNDTYGINKYINTYEEVRSSFGNHIYDIENGEFVFFTTYPVLFIPSVIIALLMLWGLNQRIKKRSI